MLDQKTGVSKPGQRLLRGKASSKSPRQQQLMLTAFVLLLIALGFVLYRDRDFWFPDSEEADSQPLSPSRAEEIPPAGTVPVAAAVPQKKKAHKPEVPRKDSQVTSDPSSTGPTITATRTVLPPLEVEVVAGDSHQTVRPGSNALHVDMQRAQSGQGPTPMRDDTAQSGAGVATPAAQRTSISTGGGDFVSRSIQPDYPTLARQMRVQGSVVMQALIGRDGLIQDLRVLSGPPILAAAAEEAVRQWHFKPHFVGSLPVETRANITVNFTISTN
jgi:TonB family protein